MNLNSLPPAAFAKLELLRQRADEANALLAVAVAQVQGNETSCMATAKVRDHAMTSEDDVKAAIRQLGVLRDEHERLMQLRHHRDEEHRKAAQVLLRVTAWLERQSASVTLRNVLSKVVEYSANTLAVRRAEIATLQSEIQRVTNSQLDRASIEEAVKSHVAALAESCVARFGGLRGEAPFDVDFTAHARTLHVPNPLETLAWWDAKTLTGKLLALIPDEQGMSLAAKEKETERLKTALLSAERAEEALIEAAAQAGVMVERRIDADPRAILRAAVVVRDAAAA